MGRCPLTFLQAQNTHLRIFLMKEIHVNEHVLYGGAEFAGPENDGPKKIKDWKMQDLENDGPNRRAGKCRTLKMTDQITGLENAGPGK